MKQPLHIVLRQYRLAALAITFFVMVLLWDMWEWFKISAETMSVAAAGAYSSMSLAIIGIVKFSLDNFTKKTEKDDHDTD